MILVSDKNVSPILRKRVKGDKLNVFKSNLYLYCGISLDNSTTRTVMTLNKGFYNIECYRMIEMLAYQR